MLVTCGEDCSVRLWSCDTLTRLQDISTHADQVLWITLMGGAPMMCRFRLNTAVFTGDGGLVVGSWDCGVSQPR